MTSSTLAPSDVIVVMASLDGDRVSCLCCLRRCFAGSGLNHRPTNRKELPSVVLDTTHMGNEVVIVKNGRRICGGGGALSNVPIVQNKAYFEVKLQQSGIWGAGLATSKTDLNKVPLGRDAESWVICSDGSIRHNGEEKCKVIDLPQEGDILGVTYDHIELNFYLNGCNMNCPVLGPKGTLYAVVYVDDGAILDVHFSDFFHQPPQGYDRIMIEQSLL